MGGVPPNTETAAVNPRVGIARCQEVWPAAIAPNSEWEQRAVSATGSARNSKWRRPFRWVAQATGGEIGAAKVLPVGACLRENDGGWTFGRAAAGTAAPRRE